MRHAALLLLCLLPWCAQGQNVTNVKFDQNHGWYIMRIDGVVHIALSDTRMREHSAEIERLRAVAVQQEQLIERMRAELKKGEELSKDYDRLRNEYLALTEQYRALSDGSVKLNERYSQLGRNLLDANNHYNKLVAEYDALTQGYRDIALRSAPRQKIDVGLGMVHAGDEDRLVGMVGIGSELLGLGLRGWVFGGRKTYGVMFGVSF